MNKQLHKMRYSSVRPEVSILNLGYPEATKLHGVKPVLSLNTMAPVVIQICQCWPAQNNIKALILNWSIRLCWSLNLKSNSLLNILILTTLCLLYFDISLMVYGRSTYLFRKRTDCVSIACGNCGVKVTIAEHFIGDNFEELPLY